MSSFPAQMIHLSDEDVLLDFEHGEKMFYQYGASQVADRQRG